MTICVLKEGVERDRAAEVMRALELDLHVPPNAPEGMFWQAWLPEDQESAVHHIDDSLTKGGDQEPLQRLRKHPCSEPLACVAE
jgi:hypothetical protein